MLKKYRYSLILTLLIIICLARVTYAFAFLKEGYHCDEAWSYGFANSEYDPYIYSNSYNILDTNENLKNYGEWVSGEVFRDYLQVAEDERFHFDSVIYNKKQDMSPSLYELLLHFVCSFFPNTFSWWYGFTVNAVCFVLMLIVIYKLCNELQDKPAVSLIITGFYGLSYGALNTILYLRMYALLTLFTLLTVYVLQKINKAEKIKISQLLALVITVFLGAFSHFYYFLFAFFLTGFFCIFTLLKKHVKKCFAVAGTMLAGVAIFFVFYPEAIGMMFASPDFYDGTLKFSYVVCINLMLNFFSVESFGVPWIIDRFFLVNFLAALLFFAIIFGLFVFLIRKEKWFETFWNKVKLAIAFIKQKLGLAGKHITNQKSFVIEASLLSAMLSFLIIVRISNVAAMGNSADRYFFFLFPIFIIVLLVPVLHSCGVKTKNQNIASIMCMVILCISLLLQNVRAEKSAYFFNKGENKTDIGALLENSNAIILSNSKFEMEWYSVVLMNTDKALYCCKSDVKEYEEALKDVPSSKDTYIIIERGNGMMDFEYKIDEKTLQTLSQINSYFENVTYLFYQNTQFGIIDVYRIEAD